MIMEEPTHLPSPLIFAKFAPAVAKTYVVTFHSINGDRPSKFIVVANDRKEAINVAWEHGVPDFQARFDKSTGQAQEMKEGAAGSVTAPELVPESAQAKPPVAFIVSALTSSFCL